MNNETLTLLLIVSAFTIIILVGLIFFFITRLIKTNDEFKEFSMNMTNASKKATEDEYTLIDTLQDAILFLDKEKNILTSNREARKLFNRENLIGTNISEIIFSHEALTLIDVCYDDDERITEKITLSPFHSLRGDREKRGENSWKFDIAPVPSGFELGSYRVIIQDRTIEFQTEQVRKDFVANASHELRTPLSVINGYLENLLEDNFVQEHPDTSVRFLSTAKKNVNRVLRIVEDMLVLSKIEQDSNSHLNPKNFDLLECVNDVVFQLEQVIKSSNASVDIDFPEETITVYGDRFYWHQVIANLVENSLKYNSTSNLKIQINATLKKKKFTLHIIDDGIGIPAKDQPHIFRRFYRVEKSHGGEKKGTGLGLSIVKRSVEAHQGSINIFSTPGMKTEFIIKAPLCPKFKKNTLNSKEN